MSIYPTWLNSTVSDDIIILKPADPIVDVLYPDQTVNVEDVTYDIIIEDTIVPTGVEGVVYG